MRLRADSSEKGALCPILVIDRKRTARRVRVAAGVLSELRRLPRHRGRGLSAAGKILSTLCRGEKVVFSITGDSRLCVQLSDVYWVRQFVFHEPYEPEVFSILSRVVCEARNLLFIDCGANCGYWSVLCSGPPFNWRCVAVEAAPTMIAQLEQNAILNEGRFQFEQAAVWHIDGVDLPFFESPQPAGSRLVTGSPSAPDAGSDVISVRTTTIDSIMERHGRDSELVIIKLDVEDAEIHALRGARQTLSAWDVLLVYEDHGADRRCRVTEFVLDELRMSVLHPRADGTAKQIGSIGSARAVKTNPNKGYNFVAYSREGAFAELLSFFDGHV